MFANVKKLLILLCSVIILSACTGEKDEGIKEEQNNKNTEETVVQDKSEGDSKEFKLQELPLPTSIEEVVQYPAGPFSSGGSVFDEEIQKVFREIPAFPEGVKEEELNELFAYLYSLFKKEYQDLREGITSYSINGKESTEIQGQEEPGSFNVEIILDSSGSMGNYMDGKTRMELAKESIQKFASTLPEEANVSLRVYGHKGTGKASDKALSCSSNELVYSPGPYSEAKMNEALNSFKPAGWTPLAASLQQAKEDLAPYKGENNTNIVYVVSDGIETCDGDPIQAAEELKNSGISPIVHVIGFDLSSKDQKQLEEIAKAAGGTYTNVKNQKQLQDEFNKTAQNASEWFSWKVGEQSKILGHSVKQKGDLLARLNQWRLDNSLERQTINNSLDILARDHKKITQDQKNKLKALNNEFYKNQEKEIEELYDTLRNEIEKEKEEQSKQIDEMYDENR